MNFQRHCSFFFPFNQCCLVSLHWNLFIEHMQLLRKQKNRWECSSEPFSRTNNACSSFAGLECEDVRRKWMFFCYCYQQLVYWKYSIYCIKSLVGSSNTRTQSNTYIEQFYVIRLVWNQRLYHTLANALINNNWSMYWFLPIILYKFLLRMLPTCYITFQLPHLTKRYRCIH